MGPIPRNLKPIFRDREELSAGHNLGEKIEAALKASENLIIICSTNAAQSHWVNQEILFFKRHNRGAKIFSVIVDGEPFTSNTQEECFPSGLRFDLNEVGELSSTPAEPLAADLRDHGDGKRLGVLKLISGMVGLGVNDLVQRDLQRLRKRVTAITASAASIVLAMGGLTWTALDARHEAEKRQVIAEDQIEFMLTDLRQEVEKVGRLDALRIVGEQALNYYHENPPSKSDLKTILRHAKGKSLKGQIFLQEEEYGQAKAYFDDAYRQINASDVRENLEALFELSQISFWQGTVEFEQKKYEAALIYFQTYLDNSNRLVGINPDNSVWRLEEIYARQNIATVQYRLGQNDIARDMIDEIIYDVEKIAARKIDNEFSKNHAFIYAWAADIYEKTDNPKAIFFREQQVAILEQLVNTSPDDTSIVFDHLQAIAGLARANINSGKFSRSKELLIEYIPTSARLVQIDQKNQQYKKNHQIMQRLLKQTTNEG